MKFFQKNLHEHTAGQGPGGGHSWQGRVHSHKHNGIHTHDENGIAHDLPDFDFPKCEVCQKIFEEKDTIIKS